MSASLYPELRAADKGLARVSCLVEELSEVTAWPHAFASVKQIFLLDFSP